MSNVTIGTGPGAVDSLALVNVDGVTIVGDGVDNPLRATGTAAPPNTLSVTNTSGSLVINSDTGFSGVVHESTGVIKCTLTNPPANPALIIPQATIGGFESLVSPLGKAIRADVANDGSIVVRTFDGTFTLADIDFYLTVTIAPF